MVVDQLNPFQVSNYKLELLLVGPLKILHLSRIGTSPAFIFTEILYFLDTISLITTISLATISELLEVLTTTHFPFPHHIQNI